MHLIHREPWRLTQEVIGDQYEAVLKGPAGTGSHIHLRLEKLLMYTHYKWKGSVLNYEGEPQVVQVVHTFIRSIPLT